MVNVCHVPHCPVGDMELRNQNVDIGFNAITLNKVWVESKFVLNVVLEPLLDLYIAAIPLPLNLD